MRAGESFPCANCGRTIRRGEPCTVYHGRWTHPTPADCLPLDPRPSSLRPFYIAGWPFVVQTPVGAQASPHVAAVPVGHARPPAGGAG